ncbi:AAA family ATPase [Clostridium magnum]|uniref:Putative AAA-ATPase n=1 Tax=Clostridium magnum DSM 2767 TaxID=1121326 RepID=A0A162QK25_9CLOT|nr:AAA family ATPase [Clostridium magnum]KZL88621.1 putative AAA-ATPase [Clostridium magnum DSM 2767]SHI15156.1 PD-(D/E)XK nuclease superfamily protein [Clostridium magnum DSM 2767]
MKKIPIGISDFREIIENNYYFVDKSLLIKEIIEDDSKVILIPRPRRFGKTLNMTMLKYFFKSIEAENINLFDNLQVSKYESIMRLQKSYPVIYITFKDMKHSSFENCMEAMAFLMAGIFEEFKESIYLDCSKEEKEYFDNILARKCSLVELEMSFKILIKLLYKVMKKKPILLIDEYDVPIQQAYLNGYYTEFIGFMRNFLSGALKDNDYIEKAVMTGILRVAKESIFSGLNNIKVYSLTSSKYKQYFGFTENEVEELLEYYNIKTKLENIRYWYNGYNFGGAVIYNPWSILNYIKDIDRGLICHWINTSSNDLIKDILGKSDNKIKVDCESLIEGDSLEKRINENIVLEDVDVSSENIWSFLLFTGYLKVSDVKNIDGSIVGKLSIPNKEVNILFKDIILGWFNKAHVNEDFNDMLVALTKGDVETFDIMFSNTVEKTLSYFDVAGESEKFYHAFVLGMLVALKDSHDVKSNRESGYGRYDVMVIPKDKSKLGLIIEFKKVNKRRNETLEEAATKALEQIEHNKYSLELKELGIKKILELAIVFDGKEVMIREKL